MKPEQLDAVATMIAMFRADVEFDISPEQVAATEALLHSYERLVMEVAEARRLRLARRRRLANEVKRGRLGTPSYNEP